MQDRFARLETLYHAARALAPEDRPRYLAANCGADEDLRREVESMLAQQGVGVLTSVATQPALAGGTVIGTYRIVEYINRGGMAEVYRARDGGASPRWSAAGNEIYFLAPDATLMAGRVETAPAFRSSAPEVLFASGLRELPNQFPYAVARDGRFLMPMFVDAHGPAPVTVLLNWETPAPKERISR